MSKFNMGRNPKLKMKKMMKRKIQRKERAFLKEKMYLGSHMRRNEIVF